MGSRNGVKDFLSVEDVILVVPNIGEVKLSRLQETLKSQIPEVKKIGARKIGESLTIVYKQIEDLLKNPNEDMIHVIGHLIGDGGNSPFNHRVFYTNKDDRKLQHFKVLFESLLGLCIKNTGGWIGQKKTILMRYDPRLSDLLQRYYPCCLSKHKYVPIFSERTFNQTLLDALIEDECHAYGYRYEFTTTKELYARTFWQLCENLGQKPSELKTCGPYKTCGHSNKIGGSLVFYFYFGVSLDTRRGSRMFRRVKSCKKVVRKGEK